MPLIVSPSRTDNIKWVYDTDIDELNHQAAITVIRVLHTVRHSVIGFATGSKPLGLYRILISNKALVTQ